MAALASSSSTSSEFSGSSVASISSVSSRANEYNPANRSEPAASERQESSLPPAQELSHNLNFHQVNPDREENPSPIDLHRSSNSSTLSTISSPISSVSSPISLQSSDKKRINRHLTGKSSYPRSIAKHIRLTARSTNRANREIRETWDRCRYTNLVTLRKIIRQCQGIFDSSSSRQEGSFQSEGPKIVDLNH